MGLYYGRDGFMDGFYLVQTLLFRMLACWVVAWSLSLRLPVVALVHVFRQVGVSGLGLGETGKFRRCFVFVLWAFWMQAMVGEKEVDFSWPLT